MIFFTSASATIQFAMLGDLRPTYAAVLCLAGLLGTVIGQVVVGALIKRWGRQSIIILIIATIIGGSTLVMGVVGVTSVLADLHEGKSQGFRPLCTSTLLDD